MTTDVSEYVSFLNDLLGKLSAEYTAEQAKLG